MGDAPEQNGLGSPEAAGTDYDRLGFELVGNLADRLPCLPACDPRGGVKPGRARERGAMLGLITSDVRGDLIEAGRLGDEPLKRRRENRRRVPWLPHADGLPHSEYHRGTCAEQLAGGDDPGGRAV